MGNIASERADLEVVVADLTDGCHLRCRAGQPALLEALEFLRHDVTLLHLDASILEHPDHGLSCDPVQETVGKGRVDFDANYDADRDDSPVSLSPDEQSLDDISSSGNGSPDSP